MSKKRDRDSVAELAGVSTATVSRVFNHPELVSAEKKNKVLSAAEKLHYHPNMNASILARGINGKILLLDNNKLLKHDHTNSFYYSWLYVDLLNQIRTVLKDTCYDLVISNLEDLRIKEADSLKKFDGIICFDIDNHEDLELVIESKVPYVFGHHVKDIPLTNKIYTDNYYGGYLQGRFLRETGHKKTIYITGMLNSINAHRERYDGFKEVFDKENIIMIEGAVGKEGGAESIKSVMNLVLSGEYNSIAAVNDLTAIGIYFELTNRGLKVPEDVSIIGYDNLPFTNLLPQRLSTIDIKIGQLYKKTADYLLKIISSDKGELNNIFKPSLIRGQTVLDRN
jgi:DNA-binding LacI/PurR family transcriptional regulator